jgi:hypothetical protein
VLTPPPHAETGWGELAPLPHTRQKEEQAGEIRSRLIRTLKWDIISAAAELGCVMAGEELEECSGRLGGGGGRGTAVGRAREGARLGGVGCGAEEGEEMRAREGEWSSRKRWRL